jgi:hypothetical protein
MRVIQIKLVLRLFWASEYAVSKVAPMGVEVGI